MCGLALSLEPIRFGAGGAQLISFGCVAEAVFEDVYCLSVCVHEQIQTVRLGLQEGQGKIYSSEASDPLPASRAVSNVIAKPLGVETQFSAQSIQQLMSDLPACVFYFQLHYFLSYLILAIKLASSVIALER
jgi:hypothetical protein